MRFACLITNVADTHSDYVIIIAFPRRQGLRERYRCTKPMFMCKFVTCEKFCYCLLSFYSQSITRLSVQLMQFNLTSYTIQYMSCTVISQWIFSNHMFTYLWNDIYENLAVKSVGLNLFSLLGSSSSSSVDASSFGYVVILSLYLTVNFVISSLTVGIF
jgi:hypothetical protein